MAASPTDETAAAAVPAARLRIEGRRLERALNWGIGAIDAEHAYRRGATGKGVMIALIDTGLAAAKADLVANVSDKSIDLAEERGDAEGDGHGAQTASLLAARRDGAGSLGVAYNATILSIRADTAGTCPASCRINGTNLARGIDYAVGQGARIIALPLEAKRKLNEIEPALARAVAAGALIVTAAGNHGDPNPSWPARYAADPRFADSIIIAGASTTDGRIASFASRAAGTEQRYLAAPGQALPANCGNRRCTRVSGTSFAVSYIAGAAALLLERHPHLQGPELAAILLDSAVDIGPRGADPESGRGLLNVARAMRLVDSRYAAASRDAGDRS